MPDARSRTRRPLALAIALACACSSAAAVTITVNDGGDDASATPCTLRNAITAINFGNAVAFPGCKASLSGLFGDNDTIVFAPSLINSIITLQQGQLSNYAPLTITGSGQRIDAAGASRVMSTIAFLSLSNLTLAGGSAGTVRGGGLYSSQAHVSLNNVQVISNQASVGGGLSIENGSANLVNTRVVGNSTTVGHGGAGLFVSASALTLTNSTVSDNAATCANDCGGGIAITNASTATITASTIARNAASGSGGDIAGGLYAGESNVTVINSTIAGNGASGQDLLAGALIENQSASGPTYAIALTNVTVSSNIATATSASATAVTGGSLIGAAGTGSLTLANTILAANAATVAGNPSAASDLIVKAGTATANNNLLGSALIAGYAGNGNVFSDSPGLAPLANRGGPTETMALLGGSPAVDAGSNALAVNAASQPLTTDQRGSPRIVHSSVDAGAFEFPGDHIFSDGFGS
jgi:hypothetical protein